MVMSGKIALHKSPSVTGLQFVHALKETLGAGAALFAAVVIGCFGIGVMPAEAQQMVPGQYAPIPSPGVPVPVQTLGWYYVNFGARYKTLQKVSFLKSKTENPGYSVPFGPSVSGFFGTGGNTPGYPANPTGLATDDPNVSGLWNYDDGSINPNSPGIYPGDRAYSLSNTSQLGIYVLGTTNYNVGSFLVSNASQFNGSTFSGSNQVSYTKTFDSTATNQLDSGGFSEMNFTYDLWSPFIEMGLQVTRNFQLYYAISAYNFSNSFHKNIPSTFYPTTGNSFTDTYQFSSDNAASTVSNFNSSTIKIVAGTVTVTGGTASNTGGSTTITGATTTSNTGGSSTITGGTTTSTGGTTSIAGGTFNSTSTGGTTQITSGIPSSNLFSGGTTTISGAAASTTNSGGAISISGGNTTFSGGTTTVTGTTNLSSNGGTTTISGAGATSVNTGGTPSIAGGKYSFTGGTTDIGSPTNVTTTGGNITLEKVRTLETSSSGETKITGSSYDVVNVSGTVTVDGGTIQTSGAAGSSTKIVLGTGSVSDALDNSIVSNTGGTYSGPGSPQTFTGGTNVITSNVPSNSTMVVTGYDSVEIINAQSTISNATTTVSGTSGVITSTGGIVHLDDTTEATTVTATVGTTAVANPTNTLLVGGTTSVTNPTNAAITGATTTTITGGTTTSTGGTTTISGAIPTTTTFTDGSTTITGATTTSNTGGSSTITGGNTTSSGGTTSISGGTFNSTSTGGTTTITGATPSSNSFSGGTTTITGASASTSNTGGATNITGGNTSTSGGTTTTSGGTTTVSGGKITSTAALKYYFLNPNDATRAFNVGPIAVTERLQHQTTANAVENRLGLRGNIPIYDFGDIGLTGGMNVTMLNLRVDSFNSISDGTIIRREDDASYTDNLFSLGGFVGVECRIFLGPIFFGCSYDYSFMGDIRHKMIDVQTLINPGGNTMSIFGGVRF
jgi:hypothetical protein